MLTDPQSFPNFDQSSLPTSAARRRVGLTVGHMSPALPDLGCLHLEHLHLARKLFNHFPALSDHRSTFPPFYLAAGRKLLSRRHYEQPPPDSELSQVRKKPLVLPHPSVLAAGDRRRRDKLVNSHGPCLDLVRTAG
jgi:hypothetical protein